MRPLLVVDQPEPDTAGNWGGNPAIDQIQLRAVDLSLIRFHRAFVLRHQSLLGRDLLLGNSILRQQGLVASEVDARVREGCFVFRQLAFGLGELNFEGTRVDLDQQITVTVLIGVTAPRPLK